MSQTKLDRRNWQFSLADVLIAPAALVLCVSSAISLDVLSYDFADAVLGVDWHTESFDWVSGLPLFRDVDGIVLSGALLALPSITAVLLVSIFVGMSGTRMGAHLCIFLPICHAWVTTYFLTLAFVWRVHFLHIVAIVPCWLFLAAPFDSEGEFFRSIEASGCVCIA